MNTAGHEPVLVLFREIGDLQGEAAALAGLGIVDGRQGRYERAADHYRQALALARQIGDRPGEAETHNGAGAVLLAAGPRAGQPGGRVRGGRPGLRISPVRLGSRPSSASARRSRNSIWAFVLRSSSAAHLASAS
jgi:hypothetical protein